MKPFQRARIFAGSKAKFLSPFLASLANDGRKLAWLMAVCGIVVVGAAIILLAVSMGTIARQANLIDNHRIADELRGGLEISQHHMANMAEVNSVWDDAVIHGYADQLDKNWLHASWGALAKAGGDYDAVYILDSDGNILWGAANQSEASARFLSDIGPGAPHFFADAKPRVAGSNPPIASIIVTGQGLSIASLALIKPSSNQVAMPKGMKRYLLLARAIDAKLIATYGKAYGLTNVALVPTAASVKDPSVGITDAHNRTLAYLTWRPRNTGMEASRAAWPMVIGVLTIIALAVAVVVATVIAGVRFMATSRNQAQVAALTDTLTGLPNRRAIVGHLAQARDARVCLAVLDLDDFKLINESYGTVTGDEALQAFAARLKGCVLKDVMVARMGGDQFALIAQGEMSETSVRSTLDRIYEMSRQALTAGPHQVLLKASAGLTASAETGLAPEILLRQADAALGEAKLRARGRVIDYNAQLDAVLVERRQIANEIVEGLAAGEFDVVYQPIVLSSDASTTAVEALARWPGRPAGRLGPDVFIDIAEHFGHIHALWSFVMRRACGDIRQLGHLTLQVNVSPVQFGDPRFLADLRTILDETGFPSSRLVVEITEGRMMDLNGPALETIAKLHAYGIKVALDDFGTGFSSLGSLRQFGFDRLKIDKSLCDHVVDDARVGALVAATVALGRALEIPVTAEGVETAEQATLLHLAGCHTLQGYLFGRPQSLTELQNTLVPNDARSALRVLNASSL